MIARSMLSQSLYDVADGFFLTIAKCGIFQTRTQAKQLQCM